jgi:hypothetical protein
VPLPLDPPVPPVPLVPVLPVPVVPEAPEPPAAVALGVAPLAPVLFEVVVAPPQEIKPIASTSANAKVASAGTEERALAMALALPTTEERFFAAPPRGPESWSEEKNRAATPLRMTASSHAATSPRAASIRGKLREDGHGSLRGARGAIEDDGFAATLTVSTAAVSAFAAKVGFGGLKLQSMPEGAPEQDRVTGPAKPPVEASVTSKVPELPASITAELGVIELVIPPTPSWTSCVWVMDPLAALMVKV